MFVANQGDQIPFAHLERSLRRWAPRERRRRRAPHLARQNRRPLLPMRSAGHVPAEPVHRARRLHIAIMQALKLVYVTRSELQPPLDQIGGHSCCMSFKNCAGAQVGLITFSLPGAQLQ